MREIGSEFWEIEEKFLYKKGSLKYFEKIGKDIKYLMSGRTAIDYILNEIVDNIKTVYMPEYCCNSMIQPFIDRGYNIRYYKIDLINNKYYIDERFNCSIFFGMSYFGYEMSNMDKYIKKFKKRNIIVIEDITHRIFCDNNYCKDSDYLIASLRKWLPIYTGAIAINNNDKFTNEINKFKINNKLVNYKKKAMNLKRKFIYNINLNNKEKFINLFNKSNQLINNYKNKKIDKYSLKILNQIDIEYIRNKRIENAKIIEQEISDNKNIKLVFKYKQGDCPLFVPVILENRDIIRKRLIDYNVYCPIHWPNFNNSTNEIYQKELSLICDQRYSKEEITSEITLLCENL